MFQIFLAKGPKKHELLHGQGHF